MNNANLSILEEELHADITERQVLLLQTKTFSFRYNLNPGDEQYFFNYSIPIIYSIWEGFIQTSFQSYVRAINRLNLTMDQLCEQLVVYNIEIKVNQLKKYPQEFPKKVSMLKKLKNVLQDSSFEIFPRVDTKSNVGFSVLNRILKDFNLKTIDDYILPRYSVATELDKFLLKIRNDISHGGNAITVNQGDIERAIRLIKLLMDEVCNRIVEGFVHEESFKVKVI